MVLTLLPSSTPTSQAALGHRDHQAYPARPIGLRKAETAESDLRPLTATMMTCYPVAVAGRRLPHVAEVVEVLVARYGSAMGLDLIVLLICREDPRLGSRPLETIVAGDLGPPCGVGRRLRGMVVEIMVVDGMAILLGGKTSSLSVDWPRLSARRGTHDPSLRT